MEGQTPPCWLWTCRNSRLKLLFVKSGSGEGVGTTYWQKTVKLSRSCSVVGKILPSGISRHVRPENASPLQEILSHAGYQKQQGADQVTPNRPEKLRFGQRRVPRYCYILCPISDHMHAHNADIIHGSAVYKYWGIKRIRDEHPSGMYRR